jgi:hypothetical protein
LSTNGDGPRLGSTADLAHRITLLETAYGELDHKVDAIAVSQMQQASDIALIRQGQQYADRLIEARFTTVEDLSRGANSKIDSLTVYLQELVAEASKAQVNWRDSPAGRELIEDLEELREGRQNNADRIIAIEKRQYATAIIVSGVVIFMNLVGPTMLRLLIPIP